MRSKANKYRNKDYWYGNNPGTYSRPSIDQKDLTSTNTLSYIQVRNGKPQIIVKGVRLG